MDTTTSTTATTAAAGLRLERAWVVWHNARERPAPGRRPPGRTLQRERPAEAVYSEPRIYGIFESVQAMWQWMNNLPVPSKMAQDANLFIFQKGVGPTWEDPANRLGGRWTYTYELADPAADRAWRDTYLALVGETLESGADVVGITATRRQHYIRLAVWTRDRENEPAVLRVGRSLKAAVAAARLEYQDHGGATRHTLA